MVNQKTYISEANFFKLLMHPARIQILDELRPGEACVCHLESALGFRQAYISQHIMVLRAAGVVQDRRDGWNIYYHVVRPEIFAVIDSMRTVTGGVNSGARRKGASKKKECPCPKCNPGKNTEPSTSM
jgi:DNA-binding transcriptional ArsR family regulator